MILTLGRQHVNRKSGPDYSARYPILLSRRVAKKLYCQTSGRYEQHLVVDVIERLCNVLQDI